MRLFKTFSLFVILNAIAVMQAPDLNAQGLPLKGFGDGKYFPEADLSAGVYNGRGISTVLGPNRFRGTVQITGADETGLVLSWQNHGYGTDEEILHVNRTFFGKLRMRIQGTTELIPLDNAGNFTALWTGRFEIVSGTGLFKYASGFADVTARNFPFQLTDPRWDFLWTWNGRISLW